MNQTFSVEQARNVLKVVDAGLIGGLGDPIPGQMCIEAAICYALGLPHGDDPSCVTESLRRFKIRLNDSDWSSPEARAKGLRALGIAQLGSKGVISDIDFSTRMTEKTIRVIVPSALRKAASVCPSHADSLEAAAVCCEQEGTKEAADAAYAAADAAAADAAAAYAAAAYAAHAARAVAYDADVAAADAAHAARAVAYDADAAARDEVLSLSATLALEVLRELGAPGVALWDQVSSEVA